MSIKNDVSIYKVPTVSGFVQREDGISGLVILSPIAAGSTLVNEQVYEWRSMRDAEADGLTYDSAELMDLAYKHVEEFFRLNNGVRLFVLISTGAATFSGVFGTAVTDLAKKVLIAGAGKIRRIGVARVTDLGTQTAGAGPAAEVLTAIPVAQALVDNEFSLYKRPVDVIIEGHGWAGTVTAATDLRATNDAKHVAVVIAQDPAVAGLNAGFSKYAAVGTMLGMAAKAGVNESIGWVQNSNLTDAGKGAFLDANLSGGVAASSYELDHDTLHDKGYTFAKKIAGVEGVYFNDAPTCTPQTNMVSFFRLAQTLHKAARAVRDQLLPHVNRPVEVDSSTGRLATRFIAFFEAEARAALDNMVADEELSGHQVYIDPEQDVLGTQTIEVLYEIVPYGAANAIQASIAMVPTLTQ